MPAPSTANTQRTCGKQCRARRRARQEKSRRDADLDNARAADRARQREYRRRKRAAEPEKRPLSQGGLSVQQAEVIGQIIEKMEQAQRLSQAGLRHQLRRLAHLARDENDHVSPRSET